jgi:hypothetical protein
MRLTCSAFNERRERRQEITMNIYTGLLFLQGHILRADDVVMPVEAPASPTAPEALASVPERALPQAAAAGH